MLPACSNYTFTLYLVPFNALSVFRARIKGVALESVRSKLQIATAQTTESKNDQGKQFATVHYTR